VAALIKPYSVEQLLGTVEAILHTADGAAAKFAVSGRLAVLMIPVPAPASSQGSSGLNTWAGLDSSGSA
jgi:hypothetical protein